MKSGTPIIFSALFLAANACAQQQHTDYADGNGTVTDRKTVGSHTYTTRRHEQEITIGNQLDALQRTVYPEFLSSQAGPCLTENDRIHIHQIKSDLDYTKNSLSVWYDISLDSGIHGWLSLGKDGEDTSYPYLNDNWAITQYLHAADATWTERRLVQQITLWRTTALFAEPGAYDRLTQTIQIHDIPVTLETKAVAINQDIQQEWWIKVCWNGKEGWLMDNNAVSTERMGPKFLTPEATVEWELGWY